MAINKSKKETLVKQYVSDLDSASNIIIIQQSAISVDIITKIRKKLLEEGAKINVVRKRLFVRALDQIKLDKISLSDLVGSIVVMYSSEEGYGMLKVISNIVKDIKRESKDMSLSFLGGWFDGEWKDSEYVSELADIPTREELLSKFVYLLNYPVQSFVATLDQIAKKDVK